MQVEASSLAVATLFSCGNVQLSSNPRSKRKRRLRFLKRSSWQNNEFAASAFASDRVSFSQTKSNIILTLSQRAGVLDPITRQLATFADSDDLVHKIDSIFSQLDRDGSGGMSFSEFENGIKHVPGIPSRPHALVD